MNPVELIFLGDVFLFDLFVNPDFFLVVLVKKVGLLELFELFVYDLQALVLVVAFGQVVRNIFLVLGRQEGVSFDLDLEVVFDCVLSVRRGYLEDLLAVSLEVVLEHHHAIQELFRFIIVVKLNKLLQALENPLVFNKESLKVKLGQVAEDISFFVELGDRDRAV